MDDSKDPWTDRGNLIRIDAFFHGQFSSPVGLDQLEFSFEDGSHRSVDPHSNQDVRPRVSKPITSMPTITPMMVSWSVKIFAKSSHSLKHQQP
jgi:hypothetical protein